jgi:hypothetical protein
VDRVFGFSRQRWNQISAPVFALALGVILVASGMVRLYGFNRPLADWHSFRQSDTASVTREYVKHGIDILRPRYHDVSNIQSGTENGEGWRMVEFPLLNALVAGILQLHPEWPLVQTHRAVSILSSMVTLLCLAWLAHRWYGKLMSVITAAIFGLLPFNIYYSRVILPEPFMVMCAVLGVALLDWWAEKTAQRADLKQSSVIAFSDFALLLSGVSFSLALLVKPVAIFFVPMYLAVAWRSRRWIVLPWIKALVVFGLAVLPLYLWRQWILQFPEGIPVSLWLLNRGGIRLRPAWWRWLFSDRIGRMMFGHWGAALLPLGAVATLWQWPKKKPARQSWMIWLVQQKDAWIRTEGLVIGAAVGALAFMVVFASGNVQHDYYQTVIIPAIALLSARGVVWLLRLAQTTWQLLIISGALGILAIFSGVFAWYDIQQLFNINNPAIVPAGQAVQRHTPEDALIIAPFMGDTTLLFATDRRGWPIGFDLETKLKLGADFYLSTALDDETRELLELYPLVEQTELYTLIDLRNPLPATRSTQRGR